MKKWRDWLVPVLTACVPWDISKVLFPPYQSGAQTPTSLTFVRIAVIILVAWGTLQFLRRPGNVLTRLKQTPAVWAVVPLLVAVVISLFGSLNLRNSLVEGARLALFICLGISVYLAVDSERVIDRVWRALFIMATVTAVFGIAQYLTGHWIWGGGINANGVRRINSTFMDPNIFARYLDISILATLLLLVGRKWRIDLVTGIALALQVMALVFTFSRTAWLILFIGIAILIVASPAKQRRPVLAIVGVLGAASFLMPSVRERLNTFSGGIEALGQRRHLLRGGLQMFTDHPFTGVGLGNFMTAIQTQYNYLLPWSGAVTKSHTTVVTVAAEMGILGILAMLCFLLGCIVSNLRTTLKLRSYALATTAGMLVIWLSSQGEGRFFEDPLLWIFWGLCMAMQARSIKFGLENIH